jgi:hypothetical protein
LTLRPNYSYFDSCRIALALKDIYRSDYTQSIYPGSNWGLLSSSAVSRVMTDSVWRPSKEFVDFRSSSFSFLYFFFVCIFLSHRNQMHRTASDGLFQSSISAS